MFKILNKGIVSLRQKLLHCTKRTSYRRQCESGHVDRLIFSPSSISMCTVTPHEKKTLYLVLTLYESQANFLRFWPRWKRRICSSSSEMGEGTLSCNFQPCDSTFLIALREMRPVSYRRHRSSGRGDRVIFTIFPCGEPCVWIPDS